MPDRTGVLAPSLAVIAGLGLVGCTTFRIIVPAPTITSLSPAAMTIEFTNPGRDLGVTAISYLGLP